MAELQLPHGRNLLLESVQSEQQQRICELTERGRLGGRDPRGTILLCLESVTDREFNNVLATR